MNEKPTENPSLATLDAQLEALKKTQPPEPSAKVAASDSARAAIDFASASSVGCALGFAADYFLHSSPWGLLTGLLLGVVAGFRMMMRVTMLDSKSTAAAKPAPTHEQ